MNCTYHPTAYASCRCPQCGRNFCKKCRAESQNGLCPDCTKVFLAGQGRKHILLTLWIFTGVFLFFGLFFSLGGEGEAGLPFALSFGYIFASLPAGWKRSAFLRPEMYSSIFLAGPVLYFVTRTFLAFIIGFFTMPLSMIMAKKAISAAKHTETKKAL